MLEVIDLNLSSIKETRNSIRKICLSNTGIPFWHI